MARIEQGLFIWPRRRHDPKYAVLITKNGTAENLTSRTIRGSFTKAATDNTGVFTVQFQNTDGALSNKYFGGETIDIYLDNIDGTKRKFSGFIDFPKESTNDGGLTISITGRHHGGRYLEIMVTKEYVDVELSAILADLITSFAPSGYTGNNIVATNPSITGSFRWQEKPFWDCVRDVCRVGEADAFVDDDKDLHFFERKNSPLRTDDAVVYRSNMVSISGLGRDAFVIKNRVKVVGQDPNGNPIIFTAEDEGAGTVKELPAFRDTNLTTIEQVQAFAEAKLAELSATIDEARTVSLGLPNIIEGETMWVVEPRQKVHGTFRVQQITHEFGNVGGRWQTTCIVGKRKRSIPRLLQDLATKSQFLQQIDNVNALTGSANYVFSTADQVAEFVNTQITSGKLAISSGTSGTATTTSIETAADVAQYELRAVGQDLDSCVFFVSVDGGSSYKQTALRTLDSPDATGRFISVKVAFSSTATNPNPQLNGVVVLYK